MVFFLRRSAVRPGARKVVLGLLLGLVASGCARTVPVSATKALLLEQLQHSHTKQDWYVPLQVATRGLTAEQANWHDSTGNHSIGQLVAHLLFWNQRVLHAFEGNTSPDFTGENEATFTAFHPRQWEQTYARLDSVQYRWYQLVEKASDQQVRQWSSEIANMAAHNAYHTGQILYIRKRNGWWEPVKTAK